VRPCPTSHRSFLDSHRLICEVREHRPPSSRASLLESWGRFQGSAQVFLKYGSAWRLLSDCLQWPISIHLPLACRSPAQWGTGPCHAPGASTPRGALASSVNRSRAPRGGEASHRSSAGTQGCRLWSPNRFGRGEVYAFTARPGACGKEGGRGCRATGGEWRPGAWPCGVWGEEDVEKDPLFREFLEAMLPRSKRHLWANDEALGDSGSGGRSAGRGAGRPGEEEQ